MILSEMSSDLPPRIWIAVIDEQTVRVFEKNNKKRKLFNEVFAVSIENAGAKLNDSLRERAFDRLVLAGARNTLGRFYQFLDKQVYIRVTAEVHKELNRMANEMLQKELASIIWF